MVSDSWFEISSIVLFFDSVGSTNSTGLTSLVTSSRVGGLVSSGAVTSVYLTSGTSAELAFSGTILASWASGSATFSTIVSFSLTASPSATAHFSVAFEIGAVSTEA